MVVLQEENMDVSQLRHEYEGLKNEYCICRRKLDSKCEALLILSRDLDQCRQERDQFKLMAEQVQERYQDLKRQLAGVGPRRAPLTGMDYTEKSSQSLAHLLCEMRDVNKSLQFEVDDLKQKLTDAQGDIKLLREQIVRQRVGTTDEGMNTRHFPAHEREVLVNKLEESKEEFVQLERDLQQVLDEKEELVTERDVYKNKHERLNTELNYILKGDQNRVVDVDTLIMENKYLKERMKQVEEEKSIAMVTLSKYKSVLEKKKNKGIQKLGQNRSGGVVITQKQVGQLLEDKLKMAPTPQMMADLQSLAGALLDTVNDKNLALSHQRKTNRLLGTRVSELENKLKTLEVAGLWSIPGGPNLSRLRQECEDIKTLIPKRASESSEDTLASPAVTPEDTPVHHQLSSVAAAPVLSNPNTLNIEDLDLLPTKEEVGTDLGAGDYDKEETPVLTPRGATVFQQECDEDITSEEEEQQQKEHSWAQKDDNLLSQAPYDVNDAHLKAALDEVFPEKEPFFHVNDSDVNCSADSDGTESELQALIKCATDKVRNFSNKEDGFITNGEDISASNQSPRCTSPLLDTH